MLVKTSAVFPLSNEAVVSRVTMSVVPKARPDTLPELTISLAPCAPLCRRSTSRARVERSLTGLLTALERKHCDPIAAAVAGTATERFHHVLTAATWEPQALDAQRVPALVAQRPPYGLLLLDETSFPQQGRSAVSGARQYAGTLGQVAHGQVVVSAPSVADEPTSSAPVHWPLSARLSRPAGWAADRARRAKGRGPTDGAFPTKLEGHVL